MVVRPVPVTWSCNACAMKWAGGDVWYLTSGVRQIGTRAMHLGRMRFAIQRLRCRMCVGATPGPREGIGDPKQLPLMAQNAPIIFL